MWGVEGGKTYSFALCLHEWIFPGMFTAHRILTESNSPIMFATSWQGEREGKKGQVVWPAAHMSQGVAVSFLTYCWALLSGNQQEISEWVRYLWKLKYFSSKGHLDVQNHVFKCLHIFSSADKRGNSHLNPKNKYLFKPFYLWS